MKHILNRYTVPWPQCDDLAVGQTTIQQVIQELDQVATKYEKVWGVDRLPRLVGRLLQEKWDAQMDKLDLAIRQEDVNTVQELAGGCIRGYAAMEADAIALGHKPPTKPEAWFTPMKCGRTLAIVATEDDARVLQSHLDHSDKTVIWPLSGIASIINEHYHKWDKQLTAIGMPEPNIKAVVGDGDFNDEIPL